MPDLIGVESRLRLVRGLPAEVKDAGVGAVVPDVEAGVFVVPEVSAPVPRHVGGVETQLRELFESRSCFPFFEQRFQDGIVSCERCDGLGAQLAFDHLRAVVVLVLAAQAAEAFVSPAADGRSAFQAVAFFFDVQFVAHGPKMMRCFDISKAFDGRDVKF